MISEVSKLWVKAGVALGNDPNSSVLCPDCRKHDLVVTDIPYQEGSGFDRLMQCPGCGSHNYLTCRKAATLPKISKALGVEMIRDGGSFSAREQHKIECNRGRWPDPAVPPDQPTWLYYEVDTVADIVLRTVEIFADGRIERDSIALEERKGDKCPSLVEGPFMETVRTVPLDLIPAVEFEERWERGTDTPFWFPDGFPQTIRKAVSRGSKL